MLQEYVQKNPFFSEKDCQGHLQNNQNSCLSSFQENHAQRHKLENFIFKQLENLEGLCLTDFKLAEFFDDEGNYQYKRYGTFGCVAPELK
ncbi:unnamed protein product (macronuclear) [Paramecium tetraurelia]|uniref:Protein kinase domain-containing protein n=1 Tax=Paramecium tetraurelia TaxID=5888 RepID=A0C903_PARTE|nr:uncharacterized protein GSPATT00006576001 [Paramecium tetraurelia]CAK67270.1 unnamed protein product [Paramecium tetraurelia]|eukprot:XP_001434667.1 hypothetical protein (macronuclear) [Paramecium tetraurelia strain d4-2]